MPDIFPNPSHFPANPVKEDPSELMKRCPACSSQYSDPTLSFCLQDGTPLVEVKQSSVDTISFSNPVTAEKIIPTQEFQVAAPPPPMYDRTRPNYQVPPPPAYDQTRPNYQIAQPPAHDRTRPNYQVPRQPRPPARKRSRKGLIVTAIVVPVLLVVTGGGAAGWWYMKSREQLLQKKNAVMSTVDDVETGKSPEKKADDPPAQTDLSPKPDPAQPAADMETVKKEVTDVINAWKQVTEDHKAAEYAAMYGDKVEYFEKHGVTPAEIKTEIQKIFTAYSEIDLEISNLVVAVDAEGDAATALFDKEWSYEASPKLSEGKAHVKLHLRKVGNAWKIVTEENLKIYYTEN